MFMSAVSCKFTEKLELEDFCELRQSTSSRPKRKSLGATVILREGGLADLGDLCYEYSLNLPYASR